MLSVESNIEVKFTDVDPLGIVWHGNYVRYFEDGREEFGKRYECRYLDFYKIGYVVPIVDVNIKYKSPLKYGDNARLVTTYLPCAAAKIIFEYKMYNSITNILVAEGRTTQVFLDNEKRNMCLTNPDFFETWKIKHLSE
jgi:acyl-CoA thioester hydrolase